MIAKFNPQTEMGRKLLESEYNRVFGRNRIAVTAVSRQKLLALYGLIGLLFVMAIAIVVS